MIKIYNSKNHKTKDWKEDNFYIVSLKENPFLNVWVNETKFGKLISVSFSDFSISPVKLSKNEDYVLIQKKYLTTDAAGRWKEQDDKMYTCYNKLNKLTCKITAKNAFDMIMDEGAIQLRKDAKKSDFLEELDELINKEN